MRRLVAATALAVLAVAAPAAAQDAHSPNLTHVTTLPYEAQRHDAQLRDRQRLSRTRTRGRPRRPRSTRRPATSHLFGNDIARGLDVYRFDGDAPVSESGGTWLTPEQALARAKLRPKVTLSPSSAFFCLL